MDQAVSGRGDTVAIARRLQAICQTGIYYTKDPFDHERYEEIRELAAALVSGAYGVPAQSLADAYFHPVPATPLVDVRAVVLDAAGHVLLVRDRVEQRWSLPGGWADVGLTGTGSVEKEVLEETGLSVRATRLLGVQDNLLNNQPNAPFHVFKMFFSCRTVGGALVEATLETDGAGYFDLADLPELSVHRTSRDQLVRYVDAHRRPEWVVDVDGLE